jgi:hypothetical protein
MKFVKVFSLALAFSLFPYSYAIACPVGYTQITTNGVTKCVQDLKVSPNGVRWPPNVARLLKEQNNAINAANVALENRDYASAEKYIKMASEYNDLMSVMLMGKAGEEGQVALPVRPHK